MKLDWRFNNIPNLDYYMSTKLELFTFDNETTFDRPGLWKEECKNRNIKLNQSVEDVT